MNDPYWMCHACIAYREGTHWKTGNTHTFGTCAYCGDDLVTLTPIVDIKWVDRKAIDIEYRNKVRSGETTD